MFSSSIEVARLIVILEASRHIRRSLLRSEIKWNCELRLWLELSCRTSSQLTLLGLQQITKLLKDRFASEFNIKIYQKVFKKQCLENIDFVLRVCRVALVRNK